MSEEINQETTLRETGGLSRRGFFGTAAVALGAGALSATGMLSGCAPTAAPTTKGDASSKGADNQSPAMVNQQDESFTEFTTDYAPLGESFTLGGLTLRNRFVKSSAGADTLSPKATAMSQNFIDYHENFAKGGAAFVWTEGLSSIFTVDPKTRTMKGLITNPGGADMFRPVADAVHKHDSYIGYQYSSMVLNSKDLTVDEIHYVQEGVVKLATLLKQAGFDAIEINAASAHFFNSFLSRAYNNRQDEYGPQTAESRTRILTELIPMIKQACGSDFIVEILMNAAEENDKALGDNDKYLVIDEAVQHAKLLEKAGADSFYIRCSVPGMHIAQFAPDLHHVGYKADGISGFGTTIDFSQHFGGSVTGQYSGCASWVDAAAEIKKNVSVPVGASGYVDPRTAPDLITDAVSEGKIDFMLMNRPLTVDPELPNKLLEGRRDEVAPCCRCMHCHNKGGSELYSGDGKEVCRVNAVTQRAFTDAMPEGYQLLPADKAKKVMVVGAGPAGMEAARIAALRGHSVTLYEKQSSLGGLVKTASAYKGEHERLGDLIAYLSRQQELTGVEVKTNTEVTADLVKQENPDAVVVAVGGSRVSKLSSSGSVSVISVTDVASSEIGERVVICGTGAQATDCALFLLAQGKKIQMVHEGTQKDIDKEQSMWVRSFVIPHLYSHGVKIWNESTVAEVVDGGLQISTGGLDKVLPCDTVVECYDMVPTPELTDSLSGYEVYAVGDCATPFNIAQAIATGNLTARKI